MSPPIPPRHCARFREERGGSKQSGYYSGGGGGAGVSRGVTGWGWGGGGRAGDDIKFWLAQFDGTTCPPHPILPILLWHCSPPKFRSGCVGLPAHLCSACGIEWHWMGIWSHINLWCQAHEQHITCTSCFMYIVWSGLVFCVLFV